MSRPTWLTTYTAVLVAVDAIAMIAATFVSNAAWLGINPGDLHIRSFAIPYDALVLFTAPTWLAILALVGAYDLGPFGTADRQARVRIVRAGSQLLAVVAVSYYVARIALLGRGVLVALIPLAVVITLAGRAAAAGGLHLVRRRGGARRTALVLGTEPAIRAVVGKVESSRAPAVAVVGTVVLAGPAPGNGTNGSGHTDIPGNGTNGAGHTDTPGTGNGNGTSDPPVATGAVEPDPRTVIEAVARTGAATVIIAGELAQDRLRDIAWTLEGTGVDLLVTTAPGRVEGLRYDNPGAELPLVHLDI